MGTNELQVQHALQVQHDESLWIVRPCNTTGCSAMLRIPRTQSATVLNCRWCQTGTDYNTDESQVRPTLINGPCITKEVFGLHLFEVIFTISALHTLRKMLNLAVYREEPRAIADLTTRYKEAKMYLANQLPTLNDTEMAQVLARYPDVVTM